MPAYCVADIKDIELSSEVAEYLLRIDETLDAFGGRFLAHDSHPTVAEGSWPGSLVILEFPDRDSLDQWYRSEVYQAIAPLRTEHSNADLVLADGVHDGYRGAQKGEELRETISSPTQVDAR